MAAHSKEVDDATVQIIMPDGTKTPKMPLKEMNQRMVEEIASVGHNSGGISGDRLRSFVQRIEKLEEDKAAVGEDLKEVYEECKGVGFNTAIVRQIVRLRKTELEKRRENEELLDLYKSALGME